MQNIRIKLGKRIRELRKEFRWSQEELGERANLHPTYVGGIERGERNPFARESSEISLRLQLVTG